MRYAPHDSNPKSSLTPSHLHMPSVKYGQGCPAPDPFSKTKAFCFVILDTLDTPNANVFLYQVLCVMHLWAMDFIFLTVGCRTPHASTTFFYGLSPTSSCLNHIPGSIPTCFTYLHTYFLCHATVSLNFDVDPFY